MDATGQRSEASMDMFDELNPALNSSGVLLLLFHHQSSILTSQWSSIALGIIVIQYLSACVFTYYRKYPFIFFSPFKNNEVAEPPPKKSYSRIKTFRRNFN
jgi:hypothetical protein